MIKNWRSHLALLTLLVSSASAHARGQPTQFNEVPSMPTIVEINPVVVLNAAAPTQMKNGGSLGWTGDIKTGFGLLTAFSLFGSAFDVETGAIYIDQLSERNTTGSVITMEMHNVQIPLLFRYNFDERVGIGLGGYTSFSNGSITTAQGTNTTYSSYSSAGIRSQDYGLLFSARASIQIVPRLFFIVDGRYQHGLTNLANIPPGVLGDVFNTRSMQAYLGLSYRFAIF